MEIVEIVRDEPYRTIRIRALTSQAGANAAENARLRASLGRLLAMKQRLSGEAGAEFAQFLKTVDDPETFVDIAAFNLCENPSISRSCLRH